MELNLDKVRANVEQAETDDLLDRATVYRAGMEPEALAIIDRELRERGITAADVAAHAEKLASSVLNDLHGVAHKCSCCDRPAITTGWAWHRMWGWLPAFPRWFRWCERHAPLAASSAAHEEP